MADQVAAPIKHVSASVSWTAKQILTLSGSVLKQADQNRGVSCCGRDSQHFILRKGPNTWIKII